MTDEEILSALAGDVPDLKLAAWWPLMLPRLRALAAAAQGEMVEKKTTGFSDWWRDTGSGVLPSPADDMETHAWRVSLSAWAASRDEGKRIEVDLNNSCDDCVLALDECRMDLGTKPAPKDCPLRLGPVRVEAKS